MNIIKKIALLTAISVTVTVLAKPAFAAMPLPMGWYIEADAGYSKSSNKNYGVATSRGASSGIAFNVDSGYKFMPYFGAEVGYTKYAKIKVKSDATYLQVAKDTNSSYQLAAKGILPVGASGAEFFAKLGVARIKSRASLTNASDPVAGGVATGSKSATGLYMGLGGDYAFMPNLAGIVQWARAKGNRATGNLDLYSVGIAYTID